jgi:hypothetical protein
VPLPGTQPRSDLLPNLCPFSLCLHVTGIASSLRFSQ